MQRPPSRNGSQKPKRPNNVVPLFEKSAGKPVKPAKTVKPSKPARANIRQASKRLQIHERNARASVAKLRPRMDFGRRVLIAIFASVSALAVLVVIAVVSPLLAVRSIEVVGTNRVAVKDVLRDLDSLKGKPLPQITSDELAAKLSKYQLIDSVSAVALPPSTLRVVIVERSAVAIVKINGFDYLYDAAGVQVGRASASDRLPVILNAGNPNTSKTFKQAIDVVLTLPVSLLGRVSAISATSKDNVVLSLRNDSQTILWGDDSQPALKASVLAALMKHYPNRYGCTFDVSSPSQPSVY